MPLCNLFPGVADDVVVAGLPMRARFWDVRTGRVLSTARVHCNDWVYAMQAVDRSGLGLAVVVGSALELHTLRVNQNEDGRADFHLHRRATLWGQQRSSIVSRRKGGSTRPHIASIEALQIGEKSCLQF